MTIFDFDCMEKIRLEIMLNVSFCPFVFGSRRKGGHMGFEIMRVSRDDDRILSFFKKREFNKVYPNRITWI